MFIKWVVYGGAMAMALMLGGAVYLAVHEVAAPYDWAPAVSIEDREYCVSADSMYDCLKSLGYKWQKVHK